MGSMGIVPELPAMTEQAATAKAALENQRLQDVGLAATWHAQPIGEGGFVSDEVM